MRRPVRSIALWMAWTLLLAIVTHIGIVLAIPWVVGIRLRSMAERNTVVHGAQPTAGFDSVRRSSPDLIYSVCVYDLSKGPLRITAPVPNTYMSVSCFALNTDNFYVRNDRQTAGSFDIVLVGPGRQPPKASRSDIVRSPTTTGGILFRYFIGDGSHDEEIEGTRREIRVARLGRDD